MNPFWNAFLTKFAAAEGISVVDDWMDQQEEEQELVEKKTERERQENKHDPREFAEMSGRGWGLL